MFYVFKVIFLVELVDAMASTFAMCLLQKRLSTRAISIKQKVLKSVAGRDFITVLAKCHEAGSSGVHENV